MEGAHVSFPISCKNARGSSTRIPNASAHSMHVLRRPQCPARNETTSPVPGGQCHHAGTGIPSCLQMRAAVNSRISLWRGTEVRRCVAEFSHIECSPPSRTSRHRVLTQVAEQVASFHGTAVCGTTRIRDAAVSSKWIGSSKSASGSVHDGSGSGSGSPWSKAVSAISTKALASNRRASCSVSPAVIVPGKSNTSAWTPCSRNLYIAL